MKAMISYSHMMEFLPGRISAYSGYLLFTDGMVFVISPLILMYLTKNTDIFFYIPIAMNIIAVIIFSVVYIPESIKYLLEKGRFDEAARDTAYVCKIN